MFTSKTNKSFGLIRWQVLGLFILVAMGTSNCQPSAPTSIVAIAPTPRAIVETQPIPGGPVLLREGMSLRSAAHVGGGSIKLEIHPTSGDLYILNPGSGLQRLKISQSNELEKVADPDDILEEANLTGMTFGPDSSLYVVANRTVDDIYNQAIIRKGTPNANGDFEWKTLAQTEPYPLSNTPFDHRFNGALVSIDGKWLYVNSGSRTDHGEVEDNEKNFPDTREVALTAKILKIPTDAEDMLLPNDEEALKGSGLIFAWGTRNAYDLAFAPNGDLFAVDNGPDADFPDELNWLREGLHYGFPWKFGDQDNPQQFPDYTSVGDKRLSPEFTAVQIGAYHTDPQFPKAPGGLTLPVANLGPDAAQYRADDGTQQNAAEEGKPLYTFTPHRSPLGLVFVTSSSMPADFQSDEDTFGAFLLSWGAAGGTLTDKGQDLLYLQLTKQNDNYEAITTQIAREFDNPIDAVLVENRLYVLDFGADGTLWEITFQ
ncbi:MAG TPA: PQQ-dependent sugar dehydrogenase [Anaerolineales bacterium]|nr:PQQ-dependent sugar dehydrogenase [Anaerolineales bacterium]